MARGRPREFDEEQAIQAALAVFRRKGFEGTTCDDLLLAMGINSGSMYAALGDKKKLYDKAFELYCDQAVGQGMRILDGPGTPLENIKALLNCWRDVMSSPDCKGCFIDSTLLEFGHEKEGIAELARRMTKRLRDTLEQKLTEAKQAGELSASVDPAEVAAFLINTKQGLSVMARAGVDKKAVHGIVNTALSVLR